jgi:uncharacterized protein (DUF302 family)
LTKAAITAGYRIENASAFSSSIGVCSPRPIGLHDRGRQLGSEGVMDFAWTRVGTAALFASALAFSQITSTSAAEISSSVSDGGVVTARSAFPLAETIERLKHDIAEKELKFFSEINQSQLAADAGVKLNPSTLLVFGNPALGSLFITSNPTAGIDWPVRLLVFENAKGEVWLAYTDFGYIARRHHIADREAAFDKASGVISSIAASVAVK